jgi:hypothetical protein
MLARHCGAPVPATASDGLAKGRQWFDAHRTDYDAGPWPSVVSRLVRAVPDDAELREAAWSWLESADLERGAGFGLWRALYDTEPASDRSNDFRRLGAKWIIECSFGAPFFGSNWEVIFDLVDQI